MMKTYKLNKRNSKNPEDRKSICFRIMVTPEERKKILELSRQNGFTNESNYARSRILG